MPILHGISRTLCNAQAWGTLDRKSTLFKLIVKFFLKGVVFMFWHDIVYTELLYSVTNFDLFGLEIK